MPSVILAEDDPEMRDLLTRVLDGVGYRVTATANGYDALHTIRGALPDVVLTDLLMPRMNGIDLCCALHNDPRTVDIPVIVITGSAEPMEVRRSLPYVAATLEKPFKPANVLTVVDVVLRSRHPLPSGDAAST